MKKFLLYMCACVPLLMQAQTVTVQIPDDPEKVIMISHDPNWFAISEPKLQRFVGWYKQKPIYEGLLDSMNAVVDEVIADCNDKLAVSKSVFDKTQDTNKEFIMNLEENYEQEIDAERAVGRKKFWKGIQIGGVAGVVVTILVSSYIANLSP